MISTLREEKKLWKKGYKRVVGLDEAGMGPLAGPVVAAAVTVSGHKSKAKDDWLKRMLRVVRDSKRLSPQARDELYKELTRSPFVAWGCGVVSEKTIDRINILQASRLAMKKALARLENSMINSRIYYRIKSRLKSRCKYRYIDFIILDGRNFLDTDIPQKCIVKADEKVFSCAAASIIAKVTRDRIMMRLHKKYPQYGFDRHKGYPTKAHIRALKRYGASSVHRKSFGPVCNEIQSSKSKAQNKFKAPNSKS